MVFVLMGLLAVQVFTGFFVNDDILYVGPYNPIVSKSVAKELTSLHHLNSDILLAAMALHVIAVLFYQFYKRQNLVGSMVTGKKAVPTTVETIKDSRIWAAVLAAAVAAAIVYGLLSFAPEPNYEDFF